MESLGIIPARGGSKGIPHKNIRQICGKPLIAFTIEAAQKSNLNRFIVSTDDIEISQIATSYNAEVMMRPIELALDESPTLPVLQHVVSNIDKKFDVIATLQPTSPLRTAQHINEALDLIKSDPEADSLVSVVQIPHHYTPGSIMQLADDGYLKNYIDTNSHILRRQEKPVYFARNGAAIYITRTNNLKEYILGGKILPYFMNRIESIDIDCTDDLVLAELIISNLLG